MTDCDLCHEEVKPKGYAIIKQPLLVKVGANETEDQVLIYACKKCLLAMAEPLEE